MVSERLGPDDAGIEVCPGCGEPDQDVCFIADIRQVYGGGEFDELQIRDQEEDREQGLLSLETLIDYNDDTGNPVESHYATWTSSFAEVAFEFRTAAAIQFVVRGERDLQGKFTYFNVCGDCGAVPHGKVDGKWQFTKNGFANRHARDCKYFSNPDGSDISVLSVAIGRKIRSDAIRFFVIDTGLLATVNSVLRLAMRVRLGGSPQHLAIRNSFLKSGTGDKTAIVTLYDTIPGGTGHLSALMPKMDEKFSSDLGGLKALRSTFEKTLAVVDGCPCQDGCYKCLLGYENQYQHDEISKDRAKEWLRGFVEANDWIPSRSPLNPGSVRVGAEKQMLEIRFRDFLKEIGAVPGLSFIQETFDQGRSVLHFKPTGGGEEVLIIHTDNDRVGLAEGYTKPDFTVIRGQKTVGYLYTDGRDPHLSPDREEAVFVNDVFLRSQLLSRMDLVPGRVPPVLSFSRDMVERWCSARNSLRTLTAKELTEVDVEIGGTDKKKIYVVAALVLELFGQSEWVYKGPSRSELFERVNFAYVSLTLAEILADQKNLFFQELHLKFLTDLCRKGLQSGKWYGGLQFDRSDNEYKFVMHVDFDRRVDGGRIRDDYKESWELFWVLWSVLPQGSVVLAKTKGNLEDGN